MGITTIRGTTTTLSAQSTEYSKKYQYRGSNQPHRTPWEAISRVRARMRNTSHRNQGFKSSRTTWSTTWTGSGTFQPWPPSHSTEYSKGYQYRGSNQPHRTPWEEISRVRARIRNTSHRNQRYSIGFTNTYHNVRGTKSENRTRSKKKKKNVCP